MAAHLRPPVIVGPGMTKIPFRPAALAAVTAIALSAGTVTPTPAVARTNILTNADNGATVFSAVGDTITVRLTRQQSQGLRWAWSKITTSDPSVVHGLSATTSPNGGASAQFDVQDPGTSTITAQATCIPAAECPDTVKLWKVTVKAQ